MLLGPGQGQGSVEAKSRLRDHHQALGHINSAITIVWQGAFNDSFPQVTCDHTEVSGPQSCTELTLGQEARSGIISKHRVVLLTYRGTWGPIEGRTLTHTGMPSAPTGEMELWNMGRNSGAK